MLFHLLSSPITETQGDVFPACIIELLVCAHFVLFIVLYTITSFCKYLTHSGKIWRILCMKYTREEYFRVRFQVDYNG